MSRLVWAAETQDGKILDSRSFLLWRFVFAYADINALSFEIRKLKEFPLALRPPPLWGDLTERKRLLLRRLSDGGSWSLPRGSSTIVPCRPPAPRQSAAPPL